MLSDIQLRMARAALNMSTRELGKELGLSAMCISRYERGDYKVISVKTSKEIEDYLESKRIFLGPKDGVCVGSNIFEQERTNTIALFHILKERGINFDSNELIKAKKAE